MLKALILVPATPLRVSLTHVCCMHVCGIRRVSSRTHVSCNRSNSYGYLVCMHLVIAATGSSHSGPTCVCCCSSSSCTSALSLKISLVWSEQSGGVERRSVTFGGEAFGASMDHGCESIREHTRQYSSLFDILHARLCP
jgi:hypothetical protein